MLDLSGFLQIPTRGITFHYYYNSHGNVFPTDLVRYSSKTKKPDISNAKTENPI